MTENKNDCLISVIIPLYNVDTYLEKCLNSVINQTYKNIEIILVEDCSSDNTLEIAKNFILKDTRIQLLQHEKNQGLSRARNTGLKSATGEYVCFIDSDDFVSEEYVEKLYLLLKKHNSDLVMCSTRCFDDQKNQFISIEKEDPYFSLVNYHQNSFIGDEKKDNLLWFPVTAWAKIYKLSIIKENKLFFPEGLIYEDNPFFIEYAILSKKISLILEPLYFYRINRKSSIISLGKRYEDIINIYVLIENILRKYNLFEELKPSYSYLVFYGIESFLYKNEVFTISFIKAVKNYFLIKDDFDQNNDKINKLKKRFIEKPIYYLVFYYGLKYLVYKLSRKLHKID